MNQKLSDWASIAEIVGGMAIVVTLVFLTFEIRSNTSVLQAQTYHDLMRDLNDFRKMGATREMVEIRNKYDEEGWNSLSSTEKGLQRAASTVRWGIYESAFYANERGFLGEQEWLRFEAGICRGRGILSELWNPGDATSMSELLTPAFVDYLESACE